MSFKSDYSATLPPLPGTTVTPATATGGGAASGGAPATGPWQPFTNPQTDDDAKVFRATYPANFRTAAGEYSLDSGASYAVATEAMRSGNVLNVPVTGAKPVGAVRVRIRADFGRPASAVVSNAAAFTPVLIDKTRYHFFGTAGFAGNSGSLWKDESGKGNHLTNNDTNDTFVLATDANGKPVLRSSDDTGGVFHFPMTSGNTDYTIYALLRPNSLQNPYLLDCPGHTLALGFNNSDFGAYYGSDGVVHGAGAVNVAANELVLIAWRLTGSVGRVYKNGVLVHTGTYAPRPFAAGAVFGHDATQAYMPFYGDAHALVLRFGSDADAEFNQTQSYLAAPVGLTIATL